jgi:hypothetical protein
MELEKKQPYMRAATAGVLMDWEELFAVNGPYYRQARALYDRLLLVDVWWAVRFFLLCVERKALRPHTLVV